VGGEMGDKGIDIYDVEELIRRFTKDMRVSEEATRELKKEMEEDIDSLIEKAVIISKHRKKGKAKEIKKEDIYLASI
jgi:histone H3/H4